MEDPAPAYAYDDGEDAFGLQDEWLPVDSQEARGIGEVTAENWRDFPDIFTDSLWYEPARWREGMHNGKYHGNFIPQIPYQAIRRFTRPGDVVLDTFLGSGTTLIECRRQGRHGIGVELIEPIAQESATRIQEEVNHYDTWQEVVVGDSTSEDTVRRVRQVLESHGRNQVQLLMMHPPYHDIIHFSSDPHDLCNAPTLADFLQSFQRVVRGTYGLLEANHFLVVVIGDKYADGEWVPLGFRTMEAVLPVGYTLKSIVVKNMEGNRAKRNLQNLWRQRAFRGKYYIFKHEYILFFQKTEFATPLSRIIGFVRELDHREELNLINTHSFVPGEGLRDLLVDYPVLPPHRILALKHGRIRAVAVDLTGLEITPSLQSGLEQFISQLPTEVVDVSVVVEPDKQSSLRGIQGVSQVYPYDEASLKQLAHAIYVVRKATGSGQRIGRETGVAFSAALNTALEAVFVSGIDYEWTRTGISFKFLKRAISSPFGDVERDPNFLVGIVTKWVSGHENEKMPQIRDRYYGKGFKLIAVIGSNVERWKSLIRQRGNFAHYYLFVGRGDEKSLPRVIQEQRLVQADGDGTFHEIPQSLVEFLRDEKRSRESMYSEGER
jgi:hypothetical protein